MTQKAIMVLAVAVVLSSLIVAFGMVTAANTIGQSVAKIQITAGSGGAGNGGTLAPTPAPAPEIDFESLKQSFAGAEGSQNAPVTIVEFSDYQCPFCRSFYE
ncbi:MAG: thioredoxin domain-containing protein, partial [Candidatus Micrarchaeota archaeon]|nr:thioredoxin domain-containing protein [Candidatus Micrarchaeota archaeon]